MPGVRSHPMALAGLSAVAAATTLVSLLTWQGFTEDFGETLGPLFVIAVIVMFVSGKCHIAASKPRIDPVWPNTRSPSMTRKGRL